MDLAERMGSLRAASWDESKHPRHERGSEGGGKFRSKGGGDTPAGDTPTGHTPSNDERDSFDAGAQDAEAAIADEDYGTLVDYLNDEDEAYAAGARDVVEASDQVKIQPNGKVMYWDEGYGAWDEAGSLKPDLAVDESMLMSMDRKSMPTEYLAERIRMNRKKAANTAADEQAALDEAELRRRDSSLSASAAGMAPLKPPSDWFDNPTLGEPTALTITADGRVYGHAAVWGTCHTGISGRCVQPPQSRSGYRYFNLGEVETEDGQSRHVGKITMDTGHAPLTASRQATAAHYDNTGAVVADVTAGEDEHGIWVAGAIRPDVPAEKVRALKAATLSGDWRSVNGALELIGMLAVNVPGFPVPRAMAAAAVTDEQIETMSLVAAGVCQLSEKDYDRKLKVLTARAQGIDGLGALAAGGGDKVHKVMSEFGKGELHSGRGGPVVKNRKQAIAIALSERAKSLRAAGTWDESKHPRNSKGTEGGGKFRSKEQIAADEAAAKKAAEAKSAPAKAEPAKKPEPVKQPPQDTKARDAKEADRVKRLGAYAEEFRQSIYERRKDDPGFLGVAQDLDGVEEAGLRVEVFNPPADSRFESWGPSMRVIDTKTGEAIPVQLAPNSEVSKEDMQSWRSQVDAANAVDIAKTTKKDLRPMLQDVDGRLPGIAQNVLATRVAKAGKNPFRPGSMAHDWVELRGNDNIAPVDPKTLGWTRRGKTRPK